MLVANLAAAAASAPSATAAAACAAVLLALLFSVARFAGGTLGLTALMGDDGASFSVLLRAIRC